MPSLKQAYQLAAALYPTGYMDLEGRQPANFTVDNDTAPVTNLTDLTLDADGQIIGVFVGSVHVSTALNGAETTILVTVERSTDFGDVDAIVPVFEVLRSKDVAADPVGDNFTEENVVATNVDIDGSTDGTVILSFDGHIVPIVPYNTTETDEDTLDFGEVIEDTNSDPLPIEVSLNNHNGVGTDPWVATSGPKMKLSLEEDGDFDTDTLEIEPNEDGSPVTIWVRFSPDSVATFDTVMTISMEGLYTKTINLLGSGVEGLISTDPDSIDFGTEEVLSSTVDSFDVEAINLQDDLVITADEGGAFTLCLTELGTYTQILTIEPDEDGVIESTEIFVKFIPPAEDTFSDTLQLTSTGSPTVTLDLDGEGIITP